VRPARGVGYQNFNSVAAASRACGIRDYVSVCVSVCLSVIKLFFKSLLLQFSSDSPKTWQTCANVQNTVEHIFESLILKFLAIFLNLKVGLSLGSSSSSSRAV